MAGVVFYRDPELPDFEIKICDDKSLSYKKHFHEEYSVGAVRTGSTKVWCGGREWLTKEGQYLSIPPGMPHSCNPDETSEWKYHMLFIRPDWIKRQGWPADRLLQEPLLLQPAVGYRLTNWMNRLIQCFANRLGPLETETAALEIMQIIRSGATKEENGAGYGGSEAAALQAVREHLKEHARDKVTLADLEQLSGLSRYHLVHAFKRAYRVPPHAYQNVVRINAAKKELTKDRSIAEVALETGFFDQSHFSKCFKDVVGVSPLKYAQSR